MPTSLTFQQHLDALAAAGERMLADATAAGMDAAVPTCPAWDVSALLAHQTMVHRWATATIRGEDASAVPDQTVIRESVADLGAHFADGLALLLETLQAAPVDLAAMTFLNDAPAPREFWARRQAHETTMHGVDALAARLGRVPNATETGIGADFAADGLEELLRGFFTRGRSKIFDGTDCTLLVAPTDSARRWLVRIGEKMTVDPGDPADTAGDATLRGTAAALYLGLWNRGEEITASGRADLLERWHANNRVTWS